MSEPLFQRLERKLRLGLVLSTFWALILSSGALAHEVMPTIGDFQVNDGALQLELGLNIEAFVAGIDLDGMTDTDASDQSDRYDALRALPPDALLPEATGFAEAFAARLWVEAGGVLTLSLEEMRIGPVGNPDLPRASTLIYSAPVNPSAVNLVLRWPREAGDLVLRQQGVENPFTGYLAGGQATLPIPLQGGAAASGLQVFAQYIVVGFDHILPKGLDHILFVLGVFFLSLRLRDLVWQVSAFTLAHTITLALGALELVTVNPAIVEPLIAASIVFVAVENLFTDHLGRWRTIVVFAFGLLHGLGFASVLDSFGLPSGQFVPALIGFNVGVEIGQLTVIAIAFATVGYWFGQRPWYRVRIAMPASVVIALIGSYWFVERVFL